MAFRRKPPKRPLTFVDIGPECFANGEETIVCWKGQEYIKTCGEFVTELADGGAAFCTLAYDHPGTEHVNTCIEEVPDGDV